ncbi:MAG: bifunctional folylpolyglutamate synthase/dihydrofolate synthase, partial [Dysgonomonas sp.]
ASIPRALNENDLKEEAMKFDLQGSTYSTVKDAVNMALANATSDDLIFIGGSNFVVAEALPLF